MTIASGQSEGTVEITPSDLPVYYQSRPKRLYRIKDSGAWSKADDLLTDAQENRAGWREVPSVTTVLGVLDKPALPWWGMKVGVEGLSTLLAMSVVQAYGEPGLQPRLLGPDAQPIGADGIIEQLSRHKLTVNHVRDKAGDRGQAVHDAFELWAKSGSLPDLSIFPPTERGYVEGLISFIRDVDPEPVGAEVLVASSEHGFAGRYDVRLRITKECDVVAHRTPVKGPQYRRLSPGLLLGDLKTSKGVYPSHARQLEAYEQASIESGYEPTDARGILHVSAEGEYEFVRSWATFEDFRVVLNVWNSDQRMKEAKN